MSHPAPPPTQGAAGRTAETADAKAAAARQQEQDHGRRWWTLAALGLAQLMVVLDATIVNIALPSAQADLGFSNADRQWVVTAYALAFGGLLLLGGRLADMLDRKSTRLNSSHMSISYAVFCLKKKKKKKITRE